MKLKNKILHSFLAFGMIECLNDLEIHYSINIFEIINFKI